MVIVTRERWRPLLCCHLSDSVGLRDTRRVFKGSLSSLLSPGNLRVFETCIAHVSAWPGGAVGDGIAHTCHGPQQAHMDSHTCGLYVAPTAGPGCMRDRCCTWAVCDAHENVCDGPRLYVMGMNCMG